MPVPLPDDSQSLLATWRGLLQEPFFWWQVGILALAAAGAVMVHLTLSQSLTERSAQSSEYAVRRLALSTLQRILFPISMLLGVLAGRALLLYWARPTDLLNLALPLLTSMASIRIVVYFLRKTFRPGPLVKAWENIIAASIWIVVALHLLGWLSAVREALDDMAMQIGDNRVSLLAVGKLILSVLLLWILALWLARLIENRISQAQFIESYMLVALAKLSKFVLLVLVFLLALDAVGIDLTALKILGGALGVGLGFGLQRIASNFISGFIVLFDRSIRPGDVITVGNTFGWVQELHARYVVVRDREGIERLIRNETDHLRSHQLELQRPQRAHKKSLPPSVMPTTRSKPFLCCSHQPMPTPACFPTQPPLPAC